MKTTERACAKLNLSLDVLGLTGSGYHDLRMVMQSVRFGDDLEIELTKDGGFSIDPGRTYLPSDDRNLALRAAKLFLRGSGFGARIRVTKRTPVCAGMGGGSSDAAAVLRALDRLTGGEKDPAALCDMALELGSDVPFCVMGGTMLAEGRGERLSPLPAIPDCAIVICKPSFSISTPTLFRQIDSRRVRLHPDTSGLTAAIAESDLPGIAHRMYNVFEDVLDHRQDAVFTIKNELLSHGALGAVMTGTGSAVFGVFNDDSAAEEAHRALSGRWRDCFLTRPAPADLR